jgi:hypothetical protein
MDMVPDEIAISALPGDGRCAWLSRGRLIRLAITGAELVYGFDPVVRPEYKKIFCIGDCTKKLAKARGYVHVPGCPPRRKDLIRFL